MKLLMLIVNDVDRLEDFFSALIELDVEGVQAVDARSATSLLAAEAPIFAGLRQLLTRPRGESKLLLGLTEDADILTRLADTLRRIDLDLDEPGVGFALLLPVEGLTGQVDHGL